MPPIYLGPRTVLARYIGARPVQAVMYRGQSLLGSVELPSEYEGQVATRTYYNTQINAGTVQTMERTYHYARDAITSLKLVFQDRIAQAETASGAATTIEASIEYPEGTFTRVQFSGANQGAMASGALLTSDATSVSIPNGAKFFVRKWRTNPNGIISAQYVSANATEGDQLQRGASVPNVVMGGTIAHSAGSISTPVAIIGMTRKPTVLIIGDSRSMGYADDYLTSVSGDVGEIARSIGASFGYINAGVFGSTAAAFWTASTQRRALSAYCSHVISNFGINDLTAGATFATMQTTLNAIWTLMSASATKKVFQATTATRTTSSDAWATTVNQTLHSSNVARVLTNDWIRAGNVRLEGFYEVADAVESARNSGLWMPGLTGDGTHENPAGYSAIVSAGAINPATITR